MKCQTGTAMADILSKNWELLDLFPGVSLSWFPAKDDLEPVSKYVTAKPWNCVEGCEDSLEIGPDTVQDG